MPAVRTSMHLQIANQLEPSIHSTRFELKFFNSFLIGFWFYSGIFFFFFTFHFSLKLFKVDIFTFDSSSFTFHNLHTFYSNKLSIAIVRKCLRRKFWPNVLLKIGIIFHKSPSRAHNKFNKLSSVSTYIPTPRCYCSTSVSNAQISSMFYIVFCVFTYNYRQCHMVYIFILSNSIS